MTEDELIGLYNNDYDTELPWAEFCYEKGRADERASLIDLIDRHMWNYSKEVWEDFQSVLKQLKEQK